MLETATIIANALEHSPPANRCTIAPGLAGWMTMENEFVCATCTGRVMARGVLLKMRRPLWHDTPGAGLMLCEVCRTKPIKR